MHKIVPHLWYDTEAGEAAALYTSLFPGSSILSRSTMSDTPSGTVEILRIEVAGFEALKKLDIAALERAYKGI